MAEPTDARNRQVSSSPPPNQPPERLMVSGPIATGAGPNAPVEVRRGMRILTRDGVEAGKVAAVAVGAGGLAAYLLQCHLPDAPDYRKVALEFVEQVGEDSIRLSLHSEEIRELPGWQSSGA